MSSSWRSRPLPRGWAKTRLRILVRAGGRCYLCGELGADTVDHVIAAAHGGSDNDSNLKAAHESCHRRKTGLESGFGVRPSRRRPPERHPGDV